MAAGGRIFSPVAQEKRKIGRSFRGPAQSPRRTLVCPIIPVYDAGLARVRVCLEGVGRGSFSDTEQIVAIFGTSLDEVLELMSIPFAKADNA